MSEKAAFVSGALFCVRVTGETSLSTPPAPPAGSIQYSEYNQQWNVILWDYGINQFNFIIASLQFIL